MPMGTGWRGAPGLTGNPGHVLARSSVPPALSTACQRNSRPAGPKAPQAGRFQRLLVAPIGQGLRGALRAGGGAGLLEVVPVVVGLAVAEPLGDELLLRALADRLELVVPELLEVVLLLELAQALVVVARVGDLGGARAA